MSSKKSKTTESTNSTIKAKYNRIFSETFKRTKVAEIQQKVITIPQLCELYKVSRTAVYKWIYAYSDLEPGVKMVVEMESEASKTQQLLERNAELERFIGQKQLEIEYLQKTLELASADLGYDIKKKYDIRSLKASGKGKEL
jgi:transposase